MSPPAVGTVLIVDDNPVDQEAVRRLLEPDYRCVDAASGAEGIEVCRRVSPECVLLDYRLPGRDGIAWLPEFLATRAGVVMLTGAPDRTTEIRSLRGGAHDYLTKHQLTRALLERAIRNAVDKAELKRELELHRKIVSMMPIAVALGRLEDPDDGGSLRFLWKNAAADHLVGGGPLVGQLLRDAFPEALQTPIPALCVDAVRTGEAQELRELAYADPRIARSVYDVKAVPLGGEHVAILGIDITLRIAALEGRRQMEEQMRAAQRLEAVGRLAGGVAHDFNNLLTVIQSYGSFLTDQFDVDDPSRGDVAAILDAADRAARLTSQLLAFSRRQVQELHVVDLNGIAREVETLLRRLIGEDIELVVELARDLGAVRVDPTQMEQVLVNLAVNARDAMPNGGRLVIATRDVEITEDGEVPPGSYVRLTVSDSGLGMDAETQEHIFEPFFTTKAPDKGTGLGLSTVFGIVKQSSGHITVDSHLGRGTRFEIYLPHVDERAESGNYARVRPASLGGTETILVVEDEVLVRRALCRTLEKHGYRVLQAARGDEAIRLLQEYGRPIHVLLTDVIMPEMSGLDLADRVKELGSDALIVFMSGYTEGAVYDRVVSAGAAFLPKPFVADALLTKLRELLDPA